jgi:hypothetical protein
MEEEVGIHSLTLYGNDYTSENIERTKQVLGSVASHGTKGERFCAGDPTNLAFVPSESFDLVYTGSIHPTIDPLNLMDSAPKGTNNRKQMFKQLCKFDDWTAKKLVELDQRAQEDWYASWVSEMVRIAKAGKIVVAMDISFPQCEDLNALGGVSKEWWTGAIDKYGWHVDPASLIIEDYIHSEMIRYHVVMRKKSLYTPSYDNDDSDDDSND